MCGNYNVASYGKTEHHLNIRSSEHIGISYLRGRRVECKPSAVSHQLLLHNHDSDFFFLIMAPFYGWDATASRLEPHGGGSLLFTTKFPEVPGTHFIDLGRMKG